MADAGATPTMASADIGGTFTDLIVAHRDRLVYRKVLSDHDNNARTVVGGIGSCLDAAEADPEQVSRVTHATTIATNALLQANGARTALITTRGFKDVLELGRMRRPSLYDLGWSKPSPLVPRALRVEVDERIEADGTPAVPLDREAAAATVAELLDAGVEAIAICLVNSYVNPVHEQALAEVVRAVAPHVYLSVSAEILRRAKEYERTSTAVINSYVGPLLDGYLETLEHGLGEDGYAAPLLLMQSNGGLVPGEMARRQPCGLIESGPAAGALAVAALARAAGLPQAIGLDIGGTTAKGCLVENGDPRECAELEVGGEINIDSRLMSGSGYVVGIRAIDLAEVGAGGGSIAWMDAGGGLKVGPRSAGSNPGPACYGRGGDQPTLTDAFAVLGFIGEDGLAGGSQPLDIDAARRVVSGVATTLGLSLEEAALGMHAVGTSSMARAVRAVTSERGRDPRPLPIVAFGGAGGLHAAELAHQLGVRRVIVPLCPGVFSSLGLLLADTRLDLAIPLELGEGDWADGLREAVELLERRSAEQWAGLGFGDEEVHSEWICELRYRGQSEELAIVHDLPAPRPDLEEAFAREHQATYGHRGTGQVVLAGIRLRARLAREATTYADVAATLAGELAPTPSRERPVYFGSGWIDTPIIARGDLVAGEFTDGPLIVAEYDSTIVVPPGCRATRDELSNISLEVGSR